MLPAVVLVRPPSVVVPVAAALGLLVVVANGVSEESEDIGVIEVSDKEYLLKKLDSDIESI